MKKAVEDATAERGIQILNHLKHNDYVLAFNTFKKEIMSLLEESGKLKYTNQFFIKRNQSGREELVAGYTYYLT